MDDVRRDLSAKPIEGCLPLREDVDGTGHDCGDETRSVSDPSHVGNYGDSFEQSHVMQSDAGVFPCGVGGEPIEAWRELQEKADATRVAPGALEQRLDRRRVVGFCDSAICQ
jgi:hypothetical protein